MSTRLFVQLAILVLLAVGLWYGGAFLEQQRDHAYVDGLLTVDGLTPAEQREIAEKAGNSRYYSKEEIRSHIGALQAGARR